MWGNISPTLQYKVHLKLSQFFFFPFFFFLLELKGASRKIYAVALFFKKFFYKDLERLKSH